MDKLFPEPTQFEITDYNTIPNLAFEVLKKMEDEIKNLNKNQDKETVIKLRSENQRKKKYLEKCDTIIEKYTIKNKASLEKALYLKKELDRCLLKINYIEIEIQNLENDKIYPNNTKGYEDLKKELEKNIQLEKKNIITLNLYESGINENKKKIEFVQRKDNKLCLIAYLELGIIITFMMLFYIYYRFKDKISFESGK